MSCDIAAVNMRVDEQDGESSLAEFAYISLRRNGGKAVGRNQPWHYRPGLLWRSPSFTKPGTEIVAEMTPSAYEATLKGQYRLDERRIRQEIDVLVNFMTLALEDELTQACFAAPAPGHQQVCRAPAPPGRLASAVDLDALAGAVRAK
jgi:hypothetical protein